MSLDEKNKLQQTRPEDVSIGAWSPDSVCNKTTHVSFLLSILDPAGGGGGRGWGVGVHGHFLPGTDVPVLFLNKGRVRVEDQGRHGSVIQSVILFESVF